MKTLTESKIRQVIREEIQNLLLEAQDVVGTIKNKELVDYILKKDKSKVTETETDFVVTVQKNKNYDEVNKVVCSTFSGTHGGEPNCHIKYKGSSTVNLPPDFVNSIKNRLDFSVLPKPNPKTSFDAKPKQPSFEMGVPAGLRGLPPRLKEAIIRIIRSR